MAASEEWTAAARDQIHNLDLTFPEHQKIFEQIGREFLLQNEGKRKKTYEDTSKRGPYPGKGCITVGVGFNMDAQSAREEWKKVFQGTVSFDEVYEKKRSLTDHEIEALLTYSRATRLQEIKNHFKGAWNKLKPNERLAIESAYYTGPTVVTKKGDTETHFFQHIGKYVNTGDQHHLESAIEELREYSNPENPKTGKKSDGMTERRKIEAEMLSSYKCPLYSKPGDPPIPRGRRIHVVQEETIIPRDADHEAFIKFIRFGTMPALPFLDKTKHDHFYIWRTQNDSRVRSSHAINEGKIFDRRLPPPTGNPGEGYNCRWSADPFIPDFVHLIERRKPTRLEEVKLDRFSNHTAAIKPHHLP